MSKVYEQQLFPPSVLVRFMVSLLYFFYIVFYVWFLWVLYKLITIAIIAHYSLILTLLFCNLEGGGRRRIPNQFHEKIESLFKLNCHTMNSTIEIKSINHIVVMLLYLFFSSAYWFHYWCKSNTHIITFHNYDQCSRLLLTIDHWFYKSV